MEVKTLRKVASLLQLIIFCLLPYQALSQPGVGTQPMAIRGGTVVNFTNRTSLSMPAFCLNKRLEAPALGSSFHNFHGRVRLTTKDGKTFERNLENPKEREDAFKYFKMSGTNGYSYLHMESDKLKRIEFLDTGLVHEGTEDEFKQAKDYLQSFEHLTANI